MSEKQVLMIAGPNGAGKTTTAMTLLPLLNIFEFVNADEIARGLNPLNPEGKAIAAGKLMLRQMQEHVGAGRNFAFETTASGLTYLKTIEACKAAGYETEMVFVWLDSAQTAVGRVANRVSKGGHFIPPDVIARRYTKGIYNLLGHYLPIFDNVTILNNTVRGLVGVPPIVADKKAGGEIRIYDTMAWQKMQETASSWK